MTESPSWQLGSDFDWDSAIMCPEGGQQEPPWVSPTEAVSYFESGRQAIASLISHLASEGRSRVMMPSHYCESMVQPFLRAGWTIDFCRVGKDWVINPPSEPLERPTETLIFSASFFGVSESSSWSAFLREERARGAVVLSDETHRVLGQGLPLADFRVASLRKMLPVPDGGALVGLDVPSSPGGKQGELRELAMKAKSQVLRGRAEVDYLRLFGEAERETDRLVAPASMSSATNSLVERLDYEFMRQRRTENARQLVGGLDGCSTRVSTAHAPVASHVVVSGPDIASLRRHLISRRIFPPVHWPEPELGPHPPWPWRTDVLSNPIDHRYTPEDMERVVAAVTEFETEQRSAS